MASRKPIKPPKRLFTHARPPALPPDSRIVASPPGSPKMSEVLEDLVAPYLGPNFDYEEYNSLLRVGVMAWTGSLLPPARHAEFIADAVSAGLAAVEPEAQAVLAEMLTDMIRRKLELYPDIRRAIVSFELTERRHEYRLVVASSPFDLPPA